jgi:hypothetical protein
MKQSKLQVLTILVAFLVLAADVRACVVAVPEVSSTALLLGVALLGLGALRRFLRR